MRSSLISYAAFSAAFSVALPSFAQTIPTDLQNLGEMTLTASGTAVAISRTGASVTVLTAEDLKAAGDASLASQLARLPGVSLSRNGGFGATSSLRIRGLGAQYVGVRIDGLDVSDPSRTQCAYDFGTTTTANLSRVEVLRGSQSALFGSEAIAGVVDITTFRAQNEGVEAKLSLEAGSANTINAVASVGMKHDRVELAFSANRFSTDGISAYAQGEEKDGARATTLTYFGSYQLTEALKLGVNGMHRNSFVEYDGGFPLRDGDQVEDGKLRGNRAFIEAELGQTSHEFAVSRVATDRYMPRDSVKTYDSTREQFAWSGAWTGSQALALSWGLDHTKESYVSDSEQGSSKTTALYGEALWAVNPDLDLSLALRHDDHEIFGGKVTNRIAGAWRPSEAWVIRAVASTGFRAPSLYELYSTYYGNPDLAPETSRSYELGAEYILNEASSWQATLFDTEIDNKIDWSGGKYRQVAGTTKARGVELVGRHNLNATWAAFGNYTYTDAYALKDGRKTAAVRVPRHDLTLGVEGQVNQKLSARATLHRIVNFKDSGPMRNYTVVDAGLNYQINDTTEGWLRVENVFDETYQTVRNYGQPGRQIFVGLGTTF